MNRCTIRALRTAGALALLAWPLFARAEGRPTLIDDYDERLGPAHAFELELGWYLDVEDESVLNVLTPAANVKAVLSQRAELELDWPTVFVGFDSDDPDMDDSRFQSGNPLLAVYTTLRVARGYARFGLGVAPPLVDLDPGDEFAQKMRAFSSALAIRGTWDPWLYAFDTLSFVVPGQWEATWDHLLLGAEGAAAVLVPVDDEVDEETDLVLQAAGTAGVRFTDVTLGAKLQVVWFATTSGDNAQLAAVPFVQADFAQAFVYGKVLFNLDEPLGLFDGGSGVWGLFAGGGGRFR